MSNKDESARSVRLRPNNAVPGEYILGFDGSWRDFSVPAEQAEYIAGVISAWLIIQAGVSYTQAQYDIKEALGIRQR